MKWNLIKIAVFGFAFVFLASGLGVMGLHFYTNMKLYPQIVSSQDSVHQFDKWILADLKTLEKYPLFKKTEFKKDAGAFLQDRLSAKYPQNHVVIKLFNQYPNWLTDKVDFKGLTSAAQFTELDPKWIEQIKPFDHWAWTRQPQIQEMIQKARKQSGIERIGILSTLPVPNFDLLKNWAAIYAIKKLQTKDLQAGLKIYRKVAELSNTTGTLVGQMQAVAILKAEHKLLNDFQARDWQVLPLPSIDAYKRLSWAWIHLVRQPFYSDLKPEFKSYASETYGICGGAAENMTILFGIREFLEPQVSFETNFSSNYARAQQFQKSLLSKCHLDDFTELTEFSSVAETNWFTDYNIFPVANISMSDMGKVGQIFQRVNWSRVPFVRKFIGLSLFSTATPDTLNMYREIASEKK
jgi:hypothetical protein